MCVYVGGGGVLMFHVKLIDTSGAPLHWQKGDISGPINVTLTNNTSYKNLIFSPSNGYMFIVEICIIQQK